MRIATTGSRLYIWLILAGLAIGALSLLVPAATPTYDPWSWLVWGRELLHGHLSLADGPSWKPLPVLFTTPFALFGSAAPNLWLVVARAGFVVSVLMVFKLAARLAWRFSAGQYGPALIGGLVAAIAYTLGPSEIVNSAMGNSEGILIAAALIALELAFDGHPRAAFAVAVIPALDRPESWAVWLPYGIWLMWRQPGARKLVPPLVIAVLALWFVPQKLGANSYTSSVATAKVLHLGTVAESSCPFCKDLTTVAWPLVPERLRYVALASILIGLVTLIRLLWRGRRVGDASERESALMLWGLTGVAGFGWMLLIAVESEDGFSGSARYMMLGAAIVYVAAGVGYGLIATLIAMLARRIRAWPRQPLNLAGAVLATLVFVLAPSWIGTADVLRSPGSITDTLRYNGKLREELASLVRRVGGPRHVVGCGQVLVEFLQAPMVAWYLSEPISAISVDPHNAAQTGRPPPVAKGGWPRVVIQDRPSPGAVLRPGANWIATWSRNAGRSYRVLKTREMSMYVDCSG